MLQRRNRQQACQLVKRTSNDTPENSDNSLQLSKGGQVGKYMGQADGSKKALGKDKTDVKGPPQMPTCKHMQLEKQRGAARLHIWIQSYDIT